MIFTLQVDEQDIEVIGSALDEIKFRLAKPVADKLQAQITAQCAAAAAAAQEKDAADAAMKQELADLKQAKAAAETTAPAEVTGAS